HPLLPWVGSCCGAFELAARYSTIDLNSNITPRPPPGSNSVGGGQQTVYAVGLNWYPNANMRFMFDYLHGKINKRFSTAAGGGCGITGTPPAPRWAASSTPSSCALRSRSEPAGRRWAECGASRRVSATSRSFSGNGSVITTSDAKEAQALFRVSRQPGAHTRG